MSLQATRRTNRGLRTPTAGHQTVLSGCSSTDIWTPVSRTWAAHLEGAALQGVEGVHVRTEGKCNAAHVMTQDASNHTMPCRGQSCDCRFNGSCFPLGEVMPIVTMPHAIMPKGFCTQHCRQPQLRQPQLPTARPTLGRQLSSDERLERDSERHRSEKKKETAAGKAEFR